MKYSFILAFVLLLSGCMTTGFLPSEERGVKQTFSDKTTKMEIKDAWRRAGYDLNSNLDALVHEGRVLILGNVKTPQEQIEAVRLAWTVDSVKEVVDEMNLEEPQGLGSYAVDTFISAQMKAEMLLNDYIHSMNYDFVTYDKTIYLIGIASSQEEAQRVLEAAQNMKAVKKVVNHIRVKGAPKLEASPLQVAESDILPGRGTIRSEKIS